eukprot:TRINITY_DN3295_c0_g1_i1.p1 TRINITY_DN3295_c0_g1~~TRINITY_DN3295_c0_g1_i1.p1  ORF type:complete len:221 (+),score=51.60 TRINITY_DN3295_c0_g1_i1:167-829(+)
MKADYLFKLIILGTTQVGKTCIAQRYCNNIYDETKHGSTLGFDFLSRQTTVGGKSVSLEIWDTAGQEQYRAIAKMYYRDAHGVILVYDIADKDSFEILKYWIDDLEMNGSRLEEKILVGNKSDLETEREVAQFEAKRFAVERELMWTECSAKTGKEVKEIFNKLVEKMVKSYETKIEFRSLFSRSTLISAIAPISKEDAEHRETGYRITSNKLSKKSNCC